MEALERRRGLLRPRPEAVAPVWIDVPSADRQSLEEIGGGVGLPLELITYCLLNQRRPKVTPCASWLYCSWQVPVFALRPSRSGDEVVCHFVEVKACLGPAALVTTQHRDRRAKRLLARLVPDGHSLVRERPGELLVTLVERVGDAYVSAHEELAAEPAGVPEDRSRRGRHGRPAAETQFLRHAHAHRAAIQKLILRGRRWLVSDEVERLKTVTERLAGLGNHRSPPTDSPDAV
jgi:Mg2+ and Co2+ transporter CorA